MGNTVEPGLSCRIRAPCKINLHLKVGVRRSDGYHDLESIFLRLAFGDDLSFRVVRRRAGRSDCEIRVSGAAPAPGGGLPEVFSPETPEGNIVHKAVSLFRAKTGYDRALGIRLRKRIPLGGGLGGGSSDGASTLLALNALAGTALSGEALLEMATSLGSDVPFFLSPGPGGVAWVSGRGEGIRPLDAPRRLWVVLVNPGFSSGTPEAFALLDRAREGEEGEKPSGPGREALIAALGGPPREWPYGNDFLPVFIREGTPAAKAAYKGILRDLSSLGADFSGLSGAGATCFGVFTDKGAAERGVDFLKKRWNAVQLTFPLARSLNAVLQ
ncbi:MAG: 4-(cytidine 5'-diphospho)-2-C-methyl-D-erythritol kinase [Spirochaetaceae bacterium]|jgi:4-diphosphocytidyl-2-C-methyl-D-erythritol kinase|nr:4-(cytidine 5'-diphospho)-2-C-methyl-D-erythritol kinase [Spirochaetaceae bacterium]